MISLAPEAVIIALGFVFTKTGWFPEHALKGLSKFAYGIAIPFLLFYTMAKLELPDQPPWALWSSYIGGTLVLMACFSLFCRKVMNQSPAGAASMAIAGGFSNLVVLGIPFNLSIIGPQAAYPVFAIISIHAFSLIAFATLMAELKSGANLLLSMWTTVKDTLSNPVIIGLLSGILWAYFDLPLYALMYKTIGKLSGAALPVALFALGGTLAGLRLKGSMSKISLMLISKLCLHPLLVSVLALYVFKLPPTYATVCILCACLPTGINGFLFASHYQQSERSVAGLILITTPLGLLLYALVASILLP
ncbi:MAG: AEC family transporter [Alphaproteobacteria bacterium]